MSEYYKCKGVDCNGNPCCCERVKLIAGPRGNPGPQGQQGIQGEKGKDAKIGVGTTETGAPGSLAEVSERIENEVCYLDFKIPRGEPAPKNTLAVAQLYKTSGEVITTANTEIKFDIAHDFQNSKVTQKQITVVNAGTYRVFYGINSQISDNASISLYKEGVAIPYSTLKLTSTQPNACANLILVLAAGEVLTLRTNQITGTLTFVEGGLNAYLNISPVVIV